MPRYVVAYFHLNPYPPKSGVEHRCLELIQGFRTLGYDVALLSSTLTAEWPPASIEALRLKYGVEVHLYVADLFDCWMDRWLCHYYQRRKVGAPVDSWLHTPPRMRRWFRQKCNELAPHLVLINYAMYAPLLPRRHNGRTAIDMIDLTTLNSKMQRALGPFLQPDLLAAGRIDPAALELDFFTRRGLAADSREFALYNRFDETIAISETEAAEVRRQSPRTHVNFIPMTMATANLANRYDGAPLFSVGPNPFNVQGYYFFVQRVLPLLTKECPSFQVDVTGACRSPLTPAEHIALRGFLRSLTEAYAAAPFALCPVFGGTGQQIKIVEAMAHGVPVIALASAAARSPINHGANGLIAHTAEEFAEHCLVLWQDRQLCRRLGQQARETIASEYSRDRLTTALAALVNRCHERGPTVTEPTMPYAGQKHP